MSKPLPTTYPAHFDNYVKQVAEDDLLEAFHKQQALIDDYFDKISEEKSTYAYAEGKWTLKEMLQHIIDAERIFAFRALCFARKELQSLPGFEEDDYAANSNANARSWKSLCEEIKVVRRSSVLMFESFTTEMINSAGTANQKSATVNAIGFVMVGHIYHHRNIIEERYLNA